MNEMCGVRRGVMGSTVDRGTGSQRRPRRTPPPPPAATAARPTTGDDKPSTSAPAADVNAQQSNGACDDAIIHKVRGYLLPAMIKNISGVLRIFIHQQY